MYMAHMQRGVWPMFEIMRGSLVNSSAPGRKPSLDWSSTPTVCSSCGRTWVILADPWDSHKGCKHSTLHTAYFSIEGFAWISIGQCEVDSMPFAWFILESYGILILVVSHEQIMLPQYSSVYKRH